MGTESLRVIGCIFAENGPLEGGIEASFWGTGWGAKGDFRRIFGPDPFIFEGGPPTIFRKHMPSGMGTESLRVIGCIFAENGPLEGGIISSFWGTGWGAKGYFMRNSYLYPYIFESRTHTFFESTCPELYAQQSWEWSDAYSWRNDLWKVNFKRGLWEAGWSPYGDLKWIFGPDPFIFEGGPHHFPKAHALRYGHRKFESDWMYIRGKWALRRWHWS